MRKLVLKMHMSLDGFVGGLKGDVEWVFKGLSGAATDWTVRTISGASLHIMGRRTFFDMAAYWPYSLEPFAAPMNNVPKAVFSRHGLDAGQKAELTQAFADAKRNLAQNAPVNPDADALAQEWAATPILTGDLAQHITRLKSQPGKPIVAHGGAGFAQNLVQAGLIDEYHLMLHPIALGAGLPLFSKLAQPMDLKLVESYAFDGGAMAQVYRPA